MSRGRNKDSVFHNVKRRRTQISDEGRLSPKHSSEFLSSLPIVNHAVQYEGHRFIHRKLIGDILHIFLFQCLYEFLRIFILLYCNCPKLLSQLFLRDADFFCSSNGMEYTLCLNCFNSFLLFVSIDFIFGMTCLLYTSPSPRD